LNPIFLDNDPDFDHVLNKTGRNDKNRRFLAALQKALPRNEWLAISSWISTFFGYQQNWLLDAARYSILVKSRQTGASHTYAAVAILWGFLLENTSIISKGQREANLVLRNVVKHCRVLVTLGSKWAVLKAASAERVVLSLDGISEAEIWSLPPSSGGRGFSSNVILDEFAYYEHPTETWDAVAAVTTHGGYKIRIMSTPNGVGNDFYDTFKHHKQYGYRLHETTIDQAIADGMNLDREDLFTSKAKGDPRVFDQLYMCSFLDSEFQYIPTHMIDACSTDDLPRSESNDAYYGGLDIGRTNDLTCLITIQKCGKVKGKQAWAVRGLEKRKRTNEEELKKLVSDGFERYGYRRLSLDATGIGSFPADSMVKKHGPSRVDPIHFTLQVKEELATGLYLALAEKRLFLPKTRLAGVDPEDIKLLKEDIASIRRIVTEAGNVKYDAPHTVNGHADRAWALALAVSAGLTAPTYARM
jgi:phage FluMu gp28-like protein